MLTFFLPAGLALSLTAGTAVAADFANYEVILTRQPFGTPAADKPSSGADANSPPPEAFVLGYRLTAVTRDEMGAVNIGVVELKSKKSYLLSSGDLEDGLSIGDVDIENGEAQLCKGGEKYWLSLLTGGVASNRAARAAAASKAALKAATATLPPVAQEPSPSAVLPPPAQRMPSAALPNLSYAARKQLRDDLRRRAAEERRRRAAEAQQLAADKPPAPGLDTAPSLMAPPANPADEELPALLAAAGATNRASLVALLEQIGYTNADAVVETEPTE